MATKKKPATTTPAAAAPAPPMPDDPLARIPPSSAILHWISATEHLVRSTAELPGTIQHLKRKLAAAGIAFECKGLMDLAAGKAQEVETRLHRLQLLLTVAERLEKIGPGFPLTGKLDDLPRYESLHETLNSPNR